MSKNIEESRLCYYDDEVVSTPQLGGGSVNNGRVPCWIRMTSAWPYLLIEGDRHGKAASRAA